MFSHQRRGLKRVSPSSHKAVKELNPLMKTLMKRPQVKNRSNTLLNQPLMWGGYCQPAISQLIIVCLLIQHWDRHPLIDRDCKNVQTSLTKPKWFHVYCLGTMGYLLWPVAHTKSLHHRGTCCLK